MAVRPFYVEGWIDGRKTPLTGGPRRSDGGMTLSVTQRRKGGIESAVQVSCYPTWVPEAGKLRQVLTTEIMIWRNGGYETIHKKHTDY